MRVDPTIPRREKCTLVIEAIGDDKVRVNHQSFPNPLLVLANQALEAVRIGRAMAHRQGAALGRAHRC